MATERYVEEWRTAGIITADQHMVLSAIARKERFSVFHELTALLYLGVVAFGAGLAWTVREHFANLGDAAILAAVGALFAGSLDYCVTRAQPYSNARVDAPTFAFDYVLYLGCLAFGVGLGYVEYRFHLLQDRWDQYLVASALLYFVLAYRFDNRFVLSLALSTLAAWFGIRLSTWWHLLPAAIRELAVAYGALVVAGGAATARLRVKPHFLDAFLHVGINAALIALDLWCHRARGGVAVAASAAGRVGGRGGVRRPLRAVRLRRLRRGLRLRRRQREHHARHPRCERAAHLLSRVGADGRRRARSRVAPVRTPAMRRYTDAEEERIRLRSAVRGWARAGLLAPAQVERIDGGLSTDLKCTNILLRVALAGFTALIVAAAVGLVFVSFHVRSETASAVLLAICGVACFCCADFLAGASRLYRFGVEETLAVLAAVLAAAAMGLLASASQGSTARLDAIVALATGAAAASVVYLRFGLVYAAIGAMVCAAVIPTQFDLSPAAHRACVAAIFAAVFLVARALYRSRGDDYPGDDYAALEAAACAGVYVALNLHLVDDFVPWPASDWSAFYWATYAATWAVPALAMADAIRAKDRALLIVGMAMALVTLATNKPYLDRPHQTWDPMLLGVLLIGAVVALRRWIASGPDQRRSGYTADRVHQGEVDLIQIAATTSVAWHDRVQNPPPADAPTSGFDGGRSAGGGAGASY